MSAMLFSSCWGESMFGWRNYLIRIFILALSFLAFGIYAGYDSFNKLGWAKVPATLLSAEPKCAMESEQRGFMTRTTTTERIDCEAAGNFKIRHPEKDWTLRKSWLLHLAVAGPRPIATSMMVYDEFHLKPGDALRVIQDPADTARVMPADTSTRGFGLAAGTLFFAVLLLLFILWRRRRAWRGAARGEAPPQYTPPPPSLAARRAPAPEPRKPPDPIAPTPVGKAGFVWVRFDLARDRRRGITIQYVQRFEDAAPSEGSPHEYRSDDRICEFRALEYYEWRMFTSYFDAQMQLMPTAVYIFDNSIGVFGLSGSLKLYPDMRRSMGEGMLALTSRGGDRFRSTPDYRVEFVDGPKGVPMQPPRPTDPATAIAATISEERLSLGDKKDIGFVYEDYGAQNAEIGVTITRIHKFEDISIDDPVPYIYSQKGLEFEFRALQYREWRKVTYFNKERLGRQHTATYIIEASIKQGMQDANCRPLTAAEYQTLRQTIKAGMWAAETNDGGSLKAVPDFRLEFVDEADDAPRWPPRPVSQDNAPVG